MGNNNKRGRYGKYGERKRLKRLRIKKIDKTYRTNQDTISLNCDEFCPGWMRKGS